MNRCDWIDCGEVGLWDGVTPSLLNSEGQKNITVDGTLSRFIFLCPRHFALAVTGLLPKKELGPTEPSQ